MEGSITGIKHFEIHDGPGIRTTLFLQGCPLRCRWCHNPENISTKPRLMFRQDHCVSCGICATICANHRIADGIHQFDRADCTGCGRCAGACPTEALSLSGHRITPQEVLPRLLEDRMFYGSQGGVTLSGGEPLLQPEFTGELLRLLKQEGIHTAVDTCCFASRAALEQVLPWTDLFLVDIKAMDRSVHIRCTGVPNEIILENIRYLDSIGKQMEIRVPLIPGFNTDQMAAIAGFLGTLQHSPPVKILPYHDYGNAKALALGIIPEAITPPDTAAMESAFRHFRDNGIPLID